MNCTTLHTDRLLLRKVEQTDINFVLEGLSNDELTKYMLIRYYTIDQVQEQMDYYATGYATGTNCFWLVQEHHSNNSLGIVGFSHISTEHKRADIGYWFLPIYQGKGYALEACKAIIAYAFTNTGLNRIQADVEEENYTSIKLMQYLNFKHEGTLVEYELNNGKLINLMKFALLRKYYINLDA